MKTVHLVRHGDTGRANAKRFLGRTDAPLSPEGRRQAKALARFFRRRADVAVLTSPLKRARQTAAALAPGRARAVASLKEVDFGRWEGLTFPEILRRDPAGVDRWASLNPGFRFPGGESLRSFKTRLRTAWKAILRHPAKEVAVVTHGGVIRTLLCDLRGLPPERYPEVQVRRGSVTTLRVRGGRAKIAALDVLP